MGIRFAYAKAATCIAAVFALAACSTNSTYPAYKDVMQDKDAFLRAHFSPDQLPARVVDRIKSADNVAPSFSQGELIMSPHGTTNTGETDKIARENVMKIVTASGGYLLAYQEDKSNEVNGVTTFATSYRGFFSLKTQYFAPGQAYGTMSLNIIEISDMPAVSEIRPNSQLVYRYTMGAGTRPSDYKKLVMTCKGGDEFPASTINPKITGGAFKLNCQVADEFGAVTNNSEVVYLENYGFAIAHKNFGPNFTVDFEVKDLQVN